MTSDRGSRWLVVEAVIAMQMQLLAEHGGSPGVRDQGLLESALARPMNRFAYEPETSVYQLAATYAHALCRNHAFVDGNKRIALVASAVFLQINGSKLSADEATAAVVFEDLAAGSVSQEQLAEWFASNCQPMVSTQ